MKTKSIRITITTTKQVQDMLTRLSALGLYGSTIAEAAERLVCEGLLRKKKSLLLEEEKTARD